MRGSHSAIFLAPLFWSMRMLMVQNSAKTNLHAHIQKIEEKPVRKENRQLTDKKYRQGMCQKGYNSIRLD